MYCLMNTKEKNDVNTIKLSKFCFIILIGIFFMYHKPVGAFVKSTMISVTLLQQWIETV